MVGYVGLVGLVWFVLEGSKSNTVTHSLKTVTQGRYRAARAAKKYTIHIAHINRTLTKS